MQQQRAQWGSRLGFVLAAVGSAVGLGNIWKFPYITGMNGGGFFVLIYLGCIGLVAMPILGAEILVGRAAALSPVGAFRKLSGKRFLWPAVGSLGILSATVILSYYSVVAGWCLEYIRLSLDGSLRGTPVDEIPSLFGALHADGPRNLLWHTLFMAATVGVVLGGVRGGVERAARILMPLLFLMLLALVIQGMTLDGFRQAVGFIFQPDPSRLQPAGVLEALGHSFFSLSVAMGTMLTYGSYLKAYDPLPESAASIGLLDTVIATLACLMIFPIIFTFGLEPSAGPGLVFQSIPMALSQLPASWLWSAIFFGLLFVAAWTSAIGLLEAPVSFVIDEWGLGRRSATLAVGAFVFLLGVPSALSGGAGIFGAGLAEATGRTWFDWFDFISSNWFLPLGGLGIATFVAWHLDEELRRPAFAAGSALGRRAAFYRVWLWLLRYLAPVGIALIFLHGLGIL